MGGALLTVRVATAFGVRLRTWSADTARALHPEFVWNRLARTFQAPGAGEAWMATARRAHPESSESAASRLALYGVPWDDATAMAAALDETTRACRGRKLRANRILMCTVNKDPTSRVEGR